MGQHSRTRDRIAAAAEVLGPGPWPRTALVGLGWTEDQLRSAVSAGSFVRLRRGVYAPAGARPQRAAAGVGALPDRVQAALLAATAPAWLGHLTAADVQGFWLPRDRDRLVHLAIPGAHDDVVSGVRTHGSPLPGRFVTTWEGVPLTTPARTGVDVARYRSPSDALMVLDSAARIIAGAREPRALRKPDRRAQAQAVAMDALRDAYGFERRWPGARSVREVLEHVDVGSESPHESWSRGWMLSRRIAMPEVGAALVGQSRRTWWVDFLWREPRIIGEADGFGKYGRSEPEVRRALRAERERQRDLEAVGWRFLRWDTAEDPYSWTSRLLAAVGPRP